MPNNATNQNLTWNIVGGSGASINASGLLTATAAGTLLF
ncbi:MAG: Ig-like domain-containing protein [Bacillota bacterium]